MDTVTHGIAGSVLARGLTDRHAARAALVLGLVAGMLPDIDLFFLHGKIAYVRGHRGWSHSFFLLPFLALALALLARVLTRSARHLPIRVLFIFPAVGIASHIFFDWITSFGIMFWIPFSRRRYNLDWVFILDPYFTGIVSVTLLAATIFRARGRRISAIGSGVLGAYVLLCAVLHSAALRAWQRMDGPPPGTKVAVLPQFLSPFRWLGLSDRGNELHVSFFDIGPFARGVASPRPPDRFTQLFSSLSDYYPPPERARIQRYAKPPPSPALAGAEKIPDVRAYLDFARFPLATVRAEPDGACEISFQDLRFLPWFSGPWERERGRGMRFRRQPFVYRVRLDRSGRAVDRGFVGSSVD
ncbi:MAG: metal-dependent hydrolase [Acidobacteriota bacterium]